MDRRAPRRQEINHVMFWIVLCSGSQVRGHCLLTRMLVIMVDRMPGTRVNIRNNSFTGYLFI